MGWLGSATLRVAFLRAFLNLYFATDMP